MKKYFFDFFGLGTMSVVAGLMFLLAHGEVVFGQGTNNIDSKSDASLKLRDQGPLTTEEKRKGLKEGKGRYSHFKSRGSRQQDYPNH